MPDAAATLEPRSEAGPGQPGTLRVCVIGGTPAHRGGVEAYCERAVAALRAHAPQIEVSALAAETAYVRPASLKRLAAGLGALVGKRHDLDLVWLQVSNLPDLLYLGLAHMLGIKVLATPHFGANSRLQRQGWRRVFCQAMLARADLIGLLFDGQESEIALPLAETVTIGTFLPLTAFADAEEAHQSARPLRLVHAARFSEEKGSFAVLDLCTDLLCRGIPFQAQLIGRADEATMSEIKARIAEAGLEAQVALPGWLDEAHMQAALRRADVLVHLSAIDSFPLIVLEALAAGTLPVIRDMVGGRHMVERLGGHVVDSSRPVADASDWIRELGLAGLREEGALARGRARDAYGWPRIVAGLEKAFRRTLRVAGEA